MDAYFGNVPDAAGLSGILNDRSLNGAVSPESSEGYFSGVHTAFYDLFRIANGKITEHWDTAEKVIPLSEWKNDNGEF